MSLRTLCLSLLIAALVVGLMTPLFAQNNQEAGQQPPPQRPAQQQEGQRDMMQIMMDLQRVQVELQETMSNPAVLTDPKLRAEAAPKATPVLKRLVGLMGEAAAVSPDPMMAEQLRAGSYQVQAILVGFGDEETRTKLKEEKKPEAEAAVALGNFIGADQKEAKLQAVGELEKVAEAHPENQAVGSAAMTMLSLGENDEQVATATKKIVTEKLKGPAAEQFQAMLQTYEQEREQDKAFREKFMNKPLVVEGEKLTGGTVSTEQYKGKVVMVDFWATWCGPCIAALPKVKEDFKKYHDQGFEIIAVSLDQTAEPLKKFLAENPEMTWPQVYTEGNPKASADIADKLGIQAIPTVFLLDRNGNVRAMAVGGGEEMEKLHAMIPELLKEEQRATAQ